MDKPGGKWANYDEEKLRRLRADENAKKRQRAGDQIERMKPQFRELLQGRTAEACESMAAKLLEELAKSGQELGGEIYPVGIAPVDGKFTLSGEI